MNRPLILKAILFAAIFPILAACEPTTIRTGDFEGWLIDGATGKPVEGASVIASWELYHQGWHGIFFRQIAEVHETVSDKDGRFAFPRVTVRNPERYTLVGDPAVYIFKPGYEFVMRTGGCWGGDPCKDPRIPRIAGERVSMISIPSKYFAPSSNTNEQISSPYLTLRSTVENIVRTCSAHLAPKFFLATDAESTRLRKLGFREGDLPTTKSIELWKTQCNPGGPIKTEAAK